MSKTRTQYALLNSAVGFISQFIRIILSFINRTIFIQFLGVTYLGINGLFTSILSILSLAELGMTTAIAYSLYKPLADSNYSKVFAYLDLFKNIYRIIALIVFILGVVVSLFLPFFMNEIDVTSQIILIYYLFLINSVISYLFTYKRTLLDADQKRYINVSVDFAVFVVGSFLQIWILFTTKNYILYLILAIVMTVVSNLVTSIVVNKIYKNAIPHSYDSLEEHEKQQFFKSVKGTLISKISETVVFGTDNLLMSTFISIVTVGLYSNYALLTTTLQRLIGQLVASLSGTVGHLVHSDTDKEKSFAVLKRLQFVVFMIVYLVSIGIIIFINIFIQFWIGQDYLLSNTVVLLISISFFLTNYRIPYLTFINSYGLFWEQRIKNVVEALLNIVLSLLFLINFQLGISGILLGTICSSLLTVVWFEPYTVLKYGLKINPFKGYRRILEHYLIAGVTLGFLYVYSAIVSIKFSITNQIMSGLVIYMGLILLFFIHYRKQSEFQYIITIIKRLITKINK